MRRREIILSYSSQIYALALGILTIPYIVSFLGVEVYGLVALFSSVQAWFLLLDFGFSTTMTQQVASQKRGRTTALIQQQFKAIYRSIALISVFATSLGLWTAHKWGLFLINTDTQSPHQLFLCMALMLVISAFRLISSYLRAIIIGFEELNWTSSFAIVSSSARFLFVFPVLWYFEPTAFNYFSYQLLISIVEFVFLHYTARNLIYLDSVGTVPSESYRSILSLLPTARALALTSLVWVICTQLDKLLISSTVVLSEFGKFSVATTLSSGLLLLLTPLSSIFIPRLSQIHAQGKHTEFLTFYVHATKAAMTIISPVAFILIFYPYDILLIWTNSIEIARYGSNFLAIYSAANLLLIATAFPFYVQIAKNDLRLHSSFNLFFVLIYVPTIYFSIASQGALGAALTWLCFNLLTFLFWIPYLHRRFLVGQHLVWLSQGILRPLLSCSLGIATFKLFTEQLGWSKTSTLHITLALIISFACTVVACGYLKFKSNI